MVKSPKKAIELVRSQILADNEASIRRLQDQLESTEARLDGYSETVATLFRRLRKRFPNALIMEFKPLYYSVWQLAVADGTYTWPEDGGTVVLARQIRNDLGADWLQIVGPKDSV